MRLDPDTWRHEPAAEKRQQQQRRDRQTRDEIWALIRREQSIDRSPK